MIPILDASVKRFVAVAALMGLSCVESQAASSAAISSSGKAMTLHENSLGDNVRFESPRRLMRHAALEVEHSLASAGTQRSKKTTVLKGQIKQGMCKNWTTGSSYLGYKENDGIFREVNDEEGCAERCDEDPACEQAMYWVDNRTCYIGVGSMDHSPEEAVEDDVYCYAKHGFEFVWAYDVRDGMCQDFFPGYKIEGDFPYARQCQEYDTNEQLAQEPWEIDEKCHHWGPEFELSERGCWGRCLANPHCLTAEYEVYKADCKLGLLPMLRHEEQKHRCLKKNDYHHQCKSRCFSRNGLGNETGSPGHSLEDMRSLLRHVYPEGMHASVNATANQTANETNATTNENGE